MWRRDVIREHGNRCHAGLLFYFEGNRDGRIYRALHILKVN